MSLTYGFYDSINVDGTEDRVYDAEQFGSIFDGVIADGVYPILNKFKVSKGTGLSVNIATGRAWFNHTWTLNDAVYNLELPAADLVNPRIDAICIEVNKTVARQNSFVVITGTPSGSPQKPSISSSISNIYRYALAYVTVPRQATEVGTIANVVGKKSEGYETPIIITPTTQVTLDDVVDKEAMQQQWDELMSHANTEVNDYLSGFGDWQQDLYDALTAVPEEVTAALAGRMKVLEWQAKENKWGAFEVAYDPEEGDEDGIITTDDGIYDISAAISYVTSSQLEEVNADIEGIQSTLTDLVIRKTYTFAYSNLAAGGYLYVTAAQLGAEAYPTGYTPIGVVRMQSGSNIQYVDIPYFNMNATGTSNMLCLKNTSSASRSGTATIVVSYIRSSVL